MQMCSLFAEMLLEESVGVKGTALSAEVVQYCSGD